MKGITLLTLTALFLFFTPYIYGSQELYAAPTDSSGNQCRGGNPKGIKDLISYYSLTGHTKIVSETLAGELKADLIRIEDVKEPDINKLYERDYFDEYKKKSAPIKKVDADLSKYKRVFIGSPIWWGEQAPEVSAFIKGKDFSGKEIVLFFTSGGGSASRAINKLTKEVEEKGGKVISSFAISIPGLSTDEIAEKAKKIAGKYKRK